MGAGICLGAAASLVLAGAGSGLGVRTVSGSAMAAQGFVIVPKAQSDELTVRVPVVPGWGQFEMGVPAPGYPSDRTILVLGRASELGKAATVIVSVDVVRDTAQRYAERLAATISKLSVSPAVVTPEQVCARAGYRIDFSGLQAGGPGAPPRSGLGLVVAPEGGRYAYIAVAQAAEPDARFVAQADALRGGLCLSG